MSSRSAGERYAIALALVARQSWQDLYSRYQDGSVDRVSALVLIHPLWYAEGPRSASCPVRGDGTFRIARPRDFECQSRLFWGYDCPFDSELHCDHVFPYSHGGPTHPSNAAWLCRYHNEAKGSDWHSAVEIASTAAWFSETLERVRGVVERRVADRTKNV
jgi:hypothetical protein